MLLSAFQALDVYILSVLKGIFGLLYGSSQLCPLVLAVRYGFFSGFSGKSVFFLSIFQLFYSLLGLGFGLKLKLPVKLFNTR